MTASIAALFRYPIKGFAPERRIEAMLRAGEAFPGDRMFAVEDGPSGFDPDAPGFIPKQRFTVLAKIADVARARTRVDEAGRLHAEAEGRPAFDGDLAREPDRTAFCAWLQRLLGDQTSGPLKLLDGLGHRFLDHPLGHLSVINLASVRDLEKRVGRPIDPMRFRANVHVEGWEPWSELGWPDRALTLGDAATRVFKPIVRCAATQVDPQTAERDIDIPAELFGLYGHAHMGIYVQVTLGGRLAEGDAAELVEQHADAGPA